MAAPVLDAQLSAAGENGLRIIIWRLFGEVFRTMLPLSAEFKRTIVYRIAEQGQMALPSGRDVGIIGAGRGANSRGNN